MAATIGFLAAELPRWDQLLREEGARPEVLGLPFFEDERPLRGAAGLLPATSPSTARSRSSGVNGFTR